MRAVWILTGIGVIFGLLGVAVSLSKPDLGPAWYARGVALTGPPSSWLGGRLRIRFETHSPKLKHKRPHEDKAHHSLPLIRRQRLARCQVLLQDFQKSQDP